MRRQVHRGPLHADGDAAEDGSGLLVVVRRVFGHQQRCLAAVLLPTDHGWFMQAGFGPCDHEAMFFETLSSAADWVQERFAE